MKTIRFALIGAASLALAACGSREEDTLTNGEENVQVEELNALADNAAMDAETEALGNEAQQNETNTIEINTDNGVTTEPSEVEDDVQGM